MRHKSNILLRLLVAVSLFIGCLTPVLALALPRVGRVLVVANNRSPASLELARQYLLARQLPPANLLALPFDHQTTISSADFQQHLLGPVEARLAEIGNSVDYIVLMRGVPYRVDKSATTAALIFQGTDNFLPLHPYAGREEAFDGTVPYYGVKTRLATVMSGYNFADVQRLIQRSQVRYRSAAAAGTIYLCDGAGPRGSRNAQIPGALAILRRLGAPVEHVPSSNINNRADVLAQFTGNTRLHLESNQYLPGSVLDNMTSFGGYLLEKNSQMSILAFVQSGACAAYGTVSEPTNNPLRWPNYTMPARYVSGFTLADSYYQSIHDITLGLVLGDPLMAPFAAPVTLNLTASQFQVEFGQPFAFTVEAREGRPGEGVAWMEFWLDDQHLLATWLPDIAAQTTCRLQILSGTETLYSRDHRTIVQELLPRVLEGFRAIEKGEVEVTRAGRHGGKLLVRHIPRQAAGNTPVVASLAFEQGGAVHRSEVPLIAKPVLTKSLVLDFGSINPQFGDEVVIHIGDRQRTVRAVRDETLPQLLERLARYINAMELFGTSGKWLVKIDKSNDAPARYAMLLLPRDPDVRSGLEVTLNLKLSEGSEFAKGLKPGRQAWRFIPVAVVAEGLLSPHHAGGEVRTEFKVPPELLSPGPHRVVVIAATPGGIEQHQELQFTVGPPPKGQVSRFSVTGELFDPGDRLTLYFGPALEVLDAYPQLIVDGHAVCNWRPGTVVGTYEMKESLIAPGPHRAWVEWAADAHLPGVLESRKPLATTALQDIFVRRPLVSEVDWQPRTLKPGAATRLVLKGPYLREGLNLFAGRLTVPLERNSADGLEFTADVKGLPPGTYKLTLGGDLREEKNGELPGELIIEERTDSATLR